MKKIIVEVDRKGAVKVEAEGFTGSNCAEETRHIIQRIGKSTSEEKKPEFYEGDGGSFVTASK